MERYDLQLFESLNEEYRTKPVWTPSVLPGKEAPSRSEVEQAAVGKNLKPILKQVDMAGKVVMELGCGHGWLIASLPETAKAARAIGADVESHTTWHQHGDSRVTFIEGDLSRENLVAPESVDVVISRVTFEHITRPLQMIQAVFDVLRFGGKLWVRTNLYRGRNASHRYREVFFPWPHLLFENEVCEAFYREHHGVENRRFSWVNGMTIAHYLQAFRDTGFDISYTHCHTTPLDLEFYLRFVEKLGRYPALDLETDFLTLLLEKNEAPKGELPSVGYLEKQRELDRALAERGQPR
jgi:SAM-dependent methyltransferase